MRKNVKDRVCPRVDTKFGAPMGRANIGERPKTGRVYDTALPMLDGCYDVGGAYWGHTGMRAEHAVGYVRYYSVWEPKAVK